MLAATLLTLATAAAAAPCSPTKQFQWASAPANAGWLSVGTSHCDSTWACTIDNGAPVSASGDYLKYVNIEWITGSGAGTFQLSFTGSTKCLDAGLNPANGTPLKVWDCYPGTMQQTFRYHDGVIELEGKNLCVDVPDGKPGPVTLQLWQCYPGNPNQQWKVTNT